jgi:3-oxoacyl-[acyl-carrier protein] reductase
LNILLTGGTRGIGYATTIYLLEAGHNVTINYLSSDDIAEGIKKRFPDSFVYMKGSIESGVDNDKLIDTAIRSFGSIDVLINNAAIGLYGLFSTTSTQDMNRLVNVNILGTSDLTKRVIPHLISSKGQVVNVSSVWGHRGASCETIYAMCKGALNQMTTSLARELGPCGVRVNTISPGLICTDMNCDLELDSFLGDIPLKRMGEPIEVARLIGFILSSSYINGANIVIDGGYSI